MVDVLFIEADSSRAAYQDLATDMSAIETPTWSLLLASSCRAKGYTPAIIDQRAERLSDTDLLLKVEDYNPGLVVFVIYGQNPNSGTTNMIGTVRVGEKIREHYGYPIAAVGTHISALPVESMTRHSFIDVAFIGDGVYALHNLLDLLSSGKNVFSPEVSSIKGIAYWSGGIPLLSPSGVMVPHDRMDIDLPGYAWDLIPSLDRYRSHIWHAHFNENERNPFAAIYTSIGCQFGCIFCVINNINKSSSESKTWAGQFRTMKYWSTEHMLSIVEDLASRGVKTLRLSDEMFYLNKKYYEPFLQGIVDRGFDLNMWTYTRIDTVNPKFLDLFKKAGVTWLAPGIESGDQEVRMEASKGSFKTVKVKDVVRTIEDAGIDVVANFIVGLPEDSMETMQATKDLAFELNTAHMNVYAVQALPGTELYWEAKEKGWGLPDTYEGYAFLSYECLPLPTKYVSAREVLAFRDRMWADYFTSEKYLSMIEKKFGLTQRRNVEKMAGISLRRKILEESRR